jgi:hypothetical protein
VNRHAALTRRVFLARGTSLTARTALQRRAPLNPVSGKRRAGNRQRRVMLNGLYSGERPLCAVWVLVQPEWCTRWADDAHEPLSRARGGSIVDPENCRAVRRACHDILTFRPESEIGWAFALGLIKHSGLCCQGRPVCSQYAETAA